MTYRVKGTLKLPDGSPAANCEIEFVSRKNLSPTVHGSKTNIKTSGTGYYDVTLELGEYAVIIYAGSTYPSQAGVIVVLADTTPGQDLPALLNKGDWTPATPEYIQQIEAWLASSGENAAAAELAANEAEESAQAAAAIAAGIGGEIAAHEAKAGAHQISGVAGLQQALDSKENSGLASSAVSAHEAKAGAHAISGITGLQGALDGKENSGAAQEAASEAVAAHKGESNAHGIENITGLRDELDSLAGWSGSSGVVVREALRRSYADAGLNLVDGSFEEGGTLTSTSDVLLHKASGIAYSGPIGNVAAGTNPAAVGSGYVPQADVILREQLHDLLWPDILNLLPKRSFAAKDFIRIPDVPGGLIIQWGAGSLGGPLINVDATLPTVFPNAGLAAVVAQIIEPANVYFGCQLINSSTIRFKQSGSVPLYITWIAVGY